MVADFAVISTIKEYKEQVADKVVDIDVAMLFLNAGIIFEKYFVSHTPEQIQAEVGVNALQPIYMTKVLLDQILARGHLSALVVTSSGLA